MECPSIHEAHEHTHGPECGHTPLSHDGHTDYLHDGHLHYPHDGHTDEHALPVSNQNPESCTPSHTCSGHEPNHVHSPTCGHEAIPHGNHVDYLVNGHLHFPHQAHCDDHGTVTVL
jgi:hypothetical protein